MRRLFQTGDVLVIRPEWSDAGDEHFKWIAMEDEDGGRIRIQLMDTGLPLPPNQIVTIDMIVLAAQQ